MKPELFVHPVKFALIALAALVCLGVGLSLRFDSLGERPLHADEATGARILADRLESGSYAFEPTHFHGPLLTAMAEPLAEIRGENDWKSLTPHTLRLGTAAVGTLTILLLLGFLPWIGGKGVGVLAAAALTATSPFLVYYSRVFIHETLFGFLAIATVLFLFLYLNKPTWCTAALLGVGAGLLMATRETFVICFFAWAGAGLLVGLEHYRQAGKLLAPATVRRFARDGLIAGLVAAGVVAAFYTRGGSHPSGIFDFFATFFVYETGEGHDKPFGYYSWMLLWPKSQGGVWWTEGGVALAALLGFASSFRHRQGPWIRFIFYAALLQWLVYSLISYKTPWLVLVAWLHLILVAGAGIGFLFREKTTAVKVATAVLFLSLLWWQNTQTSRAVHRYASDARNPYAYAPTSPDVERVGLFLTKLTRLFPDIEAGPVAVIGTEYWPLPWYLREIPATGYWQALPEGAETFPVLLVLPGQAGAARERLQDTHTALPRGLRAGTPLLLFIRNDLWDAYLQMD